MTHSEMVSCLQSPEAWDETVDDDIVMTSYTGRVSAEKDASLDSTATDTRGETA